MKHCERKTLFPHRIAIPKFRQPITIMAIDDFDSKYGDNWPYEEFCQLVSSPNGDLKYCDWHSGFNQFGEIIPDTAIVDFSVWTTNGVCYDRCWVNVEKVEKLTMDQKTDIMNLNAEIDIMSKFIEFDMQTFKSLIEKKRVLQIEYKKLEKDLERKREAYARISNDLGRNTQAKLAILEKSREDLEKYTADYDKLWEDRVSKSSVPLSEYDRQRFYDGGSRLPNAKATVEKNQQELKTAENRQASEMGSYESSISGLESQMRKIKLEFGELDKQLLGSINSPSIYIKKGLNIFNHSFFESNSAHQEKNKIINKMQESKKKWNSYLDDLISSKLINLEKIEKLYEDEMRNQKDKQLADQNLRSNDSSIVHNTRRKFIKGKGTVIVNNDIQVVSINNAFVVAPENVPEIRAPETNYTNLERVEDREEDRIINEAANARGIDYERRYYGERL